MIRFLFAIISSILISCAGNKPTSSSVAPQSPNIEPSLRPLDSLEFNCPTNSKSLLWKVAGDKNTVYLLGSIHVGVPNLYPLKDKVIKAYEASPNLVVEVNLQADSIQNKSANLQKLFTYKNDTTLKSVLSPDAYKLAEKTLKQYGLAIERFQTLKPWALGFLLTQLVMSKLGVTPEHGIESYFLSRAKGEKRILELESIESQFKMMDTHLNLESFLTYSIQSINTLIPKIEPLLKAWKCGDTQFMDDLLFNQTEEIDPETLELIYEKLFFQRNRNMTSKLEFFLKRNEDYFVIVGAGHLIGKKSIIDILSQKGFLPQQL